MRTDRQTDIQVGILIYSQTDRLTAYGNIMILNNSITAVYIEQKPAACSVFD